MSYTLGRVRVFGPSLTLWGSLDFWPILHALGIFYFMGRTWWFFEDFGLLARTCHFGPNFAQTWALGPNFGFSSFILVEPPCWIVILVFHAWDWSLLHVLKTFCRLCSKMAKTLCFCLCFFFPLFGKSFHVIFHSLQSPKICLVWYGSFWTPFMEFAYCN